MAYDLEFDGGHVEVTQVCAVESEPKTSTVVHDHQILAKILVYGPLDQPEKSQKITLCWHPFLAPPQKSFAFCGFRVVSKAFIVDSISVLLNFFDAWTFVYHTIISFTYRPKHAR
jgi:hypothetical protein